MQAAPSVKLELGACAAPEIDATLSEAHAAYRSGDFHRALQLCQTVSPGSQPNSRADMICAVWPISAAYCVASCGFSQAACG